MQTILGSSGSVGTALAKELKEYSSQIRLVCRNPEKVNALDQTLSADLRNKEEAVKAVKGSEIVYLTVGLPYDTKQWKEEWPLIMQNVIDACIAEKSKLVFFDNIYLYEGVSLDPITETLPIRPSTRKGKVRARLSRMLWESAEKEGLQVLIARSADFYGPGVKDFGLLWQTVIKPLSERGTANLFVTDECKHSYTYVPDAAKATALLGNTPDAFGDVWHLPTADHPPTGKEWVNLIAKELGVEPKYRVISKFKARFIGLFVPEVRETIEMFYQYEKDYVFDSSKFKERFKFVPRSYQEGIKEIVALDNLKVR